MQFGDGIDHQIYQDYSLNYAMTMLRLWLHIRQNIRLTFADRGGG